MTNNHMNLVCHKVNKKVAGFSEPTGNKYMRQSQVQLHIDYCSQLYMPTNSGEMEKLENLFRNFSKGVKGIDYWTRLKHLGMYSQHIRLERYLILYVWKILNRIVHNCVLEFTNEETRRGTEVITPNLKGTTRSRDQSFLVHGGNLFNSLPKYLRNMAGNNLEDFKERLDKYLQSITDVPKVVGNIPSARGDLKANPPILYFFNSNRKTET